MQLSLEPALKGRLMIRKSLLFGLFLSAVAVIAGLSSRLWQATAPPLVVVDGNPAYIGKWISKETIRGRIRLRNASGQPSVIKRIEKYCGCLLVNAGRLPLSIPADSCIDMDYVLAPADSEGAIEHVVEVHCEGYSEAFRIVLRGEINYPLPQEVDLGSFETPHERVISMCPTAVARGCVITSGHSIDPRIMVVSGSNALAIRLSNSARGDPIDCAVDVTYDRCPVSSQRVWLRGHPSGGLIAVPDTLLLGRLIVGEEPVVREVIIRDENGKSFDLDTITASSDDILVESMRLGETSALLRVSYHPTRSRSIDDHIMVRTTDDRRCIVVRCRGMAESTQ